MGCAPRRQDWAGRTRATGGPPLADCVTNCVTTAKTTSDIDSIRAALSRAPTTLAPQVRGGRAALTRKQSSSGRKGTVALSR
jgi:hypothetical protein